MKLRRVDPNKIVIPEVRVTARMDEETSEQFRASVETTGIDEPIKCYLVGEELILSDGLHRLMEALRLKLPAVDVTVREGTMEDVIANNLMSGHLRGKHPVSEMVKSAELLWTEYGLDSEKIAAKTGLTREYVENLMLISELTPAVREYVDNGELGVGQALALTRVKDPVQQETVFGQWRIYRWKTTELTAYIKEVLAIAPPPGPAQPPAAPPAPIRIKCVYCGGMFDVTEIANPATCKECSAVMMMSIAEARRQAAADQKAAADQSAAQKPNPDKDTTVY